MDGQNQGGPLGGNNIPQGELRDMKNDISSNMPRLDPPTGGGLEPPLPKFDLSEFSDINIPPDDTSGSRKIIIFSLVGVVIVLLIGAGAYFWITGKGMTGNIAVETGMPDENLIEDVSEPSEMPTATPEESISPSETPDPLVPLLQKPMPRLPLIIGVESRGITLNENERTNKEAILSKVRAIEDIGSGKIARILLELEIPTIKESFLSLADFSSAFTLSLPAALASRVSDWDLYRYESGAKEIDFCENIDNIDCAGPRLGLVFKVDSLAMAQAEMKSFETIAKTSLESLILPAINSSSYTGFKDATYNNIKLRYFNFPIAPETKPSSITSLNYAVVSAKSGTFVVIGTSRLSFYKMVDALLASK